MSASSQPVSASLARYLHFEFLVRQALRVGATETVARPTSDQARPRQADTDSTRFFCVPIDPFLTAGPTRRGVAMPTNSLALSTPQKLTLLASCLIVLGGCGGGGAEADGGQTTSELASAVSTPTMSAETASGQPTQVAAAVTEAVQDTDGALNVTMPGTVFTGQGWYVDSISGNDANPGTQAAPWKTLAKASQARLSPGDAVLLKCGGLWRESLTLSNAMAPTGGAAIGAYGLCTQDNKPVISGSDSVSATWALDASAAGKPIYVATWSKPVTQLFWNGAPLVRARFPNYGGVGAEFRLINAALSNSLFTVNTADAAALGSSDFSGAKLLIRTTPWAMESADVQSFSAATGTFTLKAGTTSSLKAQQGFYVEGKRALLDAPGEWFYDATAAKLYVWAPGGVKPSTGQLETVTRDTGVTFNNVPDSRIEKVSIERHLGRSLYVMASKRAVISGIISRDAMTEGILVDGATATSDSANARIEYSTVLNAGTNGIVTKSPGAQITSNRVDGTGMSPITPFGVAGIDVLASPATVRDNRLQSSSRSGIVLGAAAGVTASGNLVTQACRRMTDCGGIYGYGVPSGSARTTITKNTVTDIVANTEGAVGGSYDLVAGIYMDENSANHDITANTINKVGVGVNVHNGSFHNIAGNTVWMATRASVRLHSSDLTKERVRGNIVQGNRLFASNHYVPASSTSTLPTRADYFAQEWMSASDASTMFSGTNPNVVRDNVVGTMSDATTVHWAMYDGSTRRTPNPSQWSAYATNDTVQLAFAAKPMLITTTGSDLIQNPVLATPGTPWDIYVAPASGGTRVTYGACGAAGCADVVPSTGDVFFSNTFNMSSTVGNNLYVMRLRAQAMTPTASLSMTVNRISGDWQYLGFIIRNQVFAYTEETQVESLFFATSSDTARFSVYGNSGQAYRLRGASLLKVAGYELFNPARESALLVNETAATKLVDCTASGLRSCTASDLAGRPIAWPVSLPPYGSLVAVVSDAKWKP